MIRDAPSAIRQAFQVYLSRRIEALDGEPNQAAERERFVSLRQTSRRFYERRIEGAVASGDVLRVLQLNELILPTPDRLEKLKRVHELIGIAPPMLITLQETTEVWGRYNTAVELARALGYPYQEYLYKDHHAGQFPQEAAASREGLAILFHPSFEAVGGFFHLRLPPPEHNRILLGLRLRSRRDGREIYVFTVHLSANPLDTPWRREQVDAIRSYIARVAPPTAAVVLTGDFNYASAIETEETSRRLDGFVDTFAALNPGVGGLTYSKRNPLVDHAQNQNRMDMIYARGSVPLGSWVVLDEGPDFPSDHFGVVADLVFDEPAVVPSSAALAVLAEALGRIDEAEGVQALVGAMEGELVSGRLSREEARFVLSSLGVDRERTLPEPAESQDEAPEWSQK